MNKFDVHHCNVPYRADIGLDKRGLWGQAINSCDEYKDGTLWVNNGEYGSQVNFCPVCGYEAKVKVIDKNTKQ